MRTTLFLFLIFLSSISFAGTIKGKILDHHNEPLPGVTVRIQGTAYGGISDSKGRFNIDVEEGTYILQVSSVGFETNAKTVTVPGRGVILVDFQMKESITELEEVVVKSKTFEQEKMEDPIKVEIINTKKLQAQSISLPQIINQTSGVKVRQTGGVGSSTNININGLQGSAIRFFKDGIPLDYLGRAFDLSLVPVDQLSNIEIYKGVLPVKLGADALGGAINFVTDNTVQNNLGTAYSFGSFNTHQVNLNGTLVIPQTPLFIGLSSYYVTSDNNYRLDVPVVNNETRNLEMREVERFHDEIETFYTELKFGINNTKIADSWYISGSFFDLEQDNQNNILLSTPYGEAFSTERSYIGTTRYQKRVDKLSIDAFLAYSDRNTKLIDTVNVRYNWLREITSTGTGPGGEISDIGSDQSLDFETWTGRLYLTYNLHPNHFLYFNHNLISERRQGTDPRAPKLPGTDIDPLSLTAKYRRNITGFGLSSSFIGEQLKSEIAIKRYELLTSSVSPFALNDNVEEFTNVNYGAGASFKYSLSNQKYIRLSYELATRIPNTEEYLGNPSQFILGNPSLLPETSHNVNLGVYTNLNKDNTYWLDVNTFYRYINDNIFLIPGLVTSQYRNQDDARSIGVELSLRGEIVNDLTFSTAVTYQDIRRTGIQDVSNALLDGARQPNTPYFFTNLSLRYKKDNLGSIPGSWQFYTNYSFVEKYLLESVSREQEPPLFGEVGSITEQIIPSQHVVDAGVTYRFENLPLWLNMELNNVLDLEVYDSYRVQRPGLNYRFKVRYSLN